MLQSDARQAFELFGWCLQKTEVKGKVFATTIGIWTDILSRRSINTL